ncbi:MAG: YciI family protein [Dehalococcoidia bacterium]
MKYALLIYSDEAAWQNASEETKQRVYAGHAKLGEELQKRKAQVTGYELAPQREAKTAKLGDSPAVTDGPFAEAKESLGGFYVVECAGMDEALALAKMIPAVATTSIEVRPVLEQ